MSEAGRAVTFLGHVCDYDRRLMFVNVVSLLFLLVSVAAFAAVDLPLDTFVVSVMNVVGLSVLSVGFAVVLWACARIER